MERIRKSKSVKDGHEIRLGRNAPPPAPNEVKKLRKMCNAARVIMQLANATNRRRAVRATRNAGAQMTAKHLQRASVRVTYVKPKMAGHWRAHGLYLQRETAAGKDPAGFNHEETGVDIPQRLESWQSSGDSKLFRVIISPEEGERLSMAEYTKQVMRRVEEQTGMQLEWVGVVHNNTDHPHAHVAIRGVTRDGKDVHFDRDFIKSGFRAEAQHAATDTLGYRTKQQIEQAMMREMTQSRYTSLDRMIERAATKDSSSATLHVRVGSPEFKQVTRGDLARLFALERRMYHLEDIGLARRVGDKAWELPADYDRTLRALQLAGDKQKMLGRSMEPASSNKQPVITMQWSQVEHLHARILGHGEDEATGRRFMMLETVSGNVVYLPHRADTEAMRNQQQLTRNHFVTFSRGPRGRLLVEDHGTAAEALQDRALMAQLAKEQPAGYGRPGWLGELDTAMDQAAHNTYATPEARFAIRLQREEVALLFNGAYARSSAAADRAFAAIHGDPGRATLKEQGIEIKFSEKTQNYFAFVTQSEKTKLTNTLQDLSRKKERVAQRAKEREHERG